MKKILFFFLFFLFSNILFSQRVVGSNYLIEHNVNSTIGQENKNDSLYNYYMKRWDKRVKISFVILGVAGASTYFIHNFINPNHINTKTLYYVNVGMYMVSATFYLSANKERKKAYKYL